MRAIASALIARRSALLRGDEERARAGNSSPRAKTRLGKNLSRTQKNVDGNFVQLYISHLKGGTSAMAKKKKTTKKAAKKSTKKKK